MAKKVALLTMFDVANYGSVLQTFASQTVLERLGYKCDVINYKFPNKWHFRNGYFRPKKYRRVISMILRLCGYKSFWRKYKETIDVFKNSRLNLTSTRFNSLESLDAYDWCQYSHVVSGSDQVWNPRFMKGDKAFLLSFIPDNISKISMASSFACSSLDANYRNNYKKYLSRFSHISVRDNNGVDIIKGLGINKNVEVLLDPTLLLSGDEWSKELKIEKKQIDSQYILVYVLNYAFEPAPYIYSVAKEMQRRTGKKIMFIGAIQHEYLNTIISYEIKNCIPVEEFVTLFANAFMVITSSFHGTAFAVNYNKPLIAIIPSNGDDRQTTLLKNLGLQVCTARVGTSLETLNPYYDTNVVSQKLGKIREYNISWLSKALKDSIIHQK